MPTAPSNANVDGCLRRRRYVVALAALLTAPRIATSQGTRRPLVVGLLGPAGPGGPFPDGLIATLGKLGLGQGRDYALDARWSGGDDTRLPQLAADLVSDGAALIVVTGNRATEAATRATRSVPIVMLGVALPVENAYISTLARPGGNVTGTSWDPPEIAGKKLEVIRDAIPGARRIALLWAPEFPGMRIYGAYADRAAAAFGMTLEHFDVVQPGDFDRALVRIAAYRPDALYVVPSDEVGRRLSNVVAFARERKLVTFGATPAIIGAGGVLYYGPAFADLFERGASYVARILRGAKPADLPVEQPRIYELVVNAKAARDIGHQVPQALLLRADRVIE